MKMTHPTTEQKAEFHSHQRRLFQAGIIPPRAAMEQIVVHDCGRSFRPSDRGITRHVYGDDAVLYTALCDCGSHITVWSEWPEPEEPAVDVGEVREVWDDA